MKKKLLITVIMILYLYGCQERKNNGVFYCQVENKIEEYPDSSFFSNITCMNYDDGKLYVLDNKRGDIVELNDDLNKMKYVSRHGEAPYETVMPFAFSLLNDTVYVVDFGTRSMKKFIMGSLWEVLHFRMPMRTDFVSMILCYSYQLRQIQRVFSKLLLGIRVNKFN